MNCWHWSNKILDVSATLRAPHAPGHCSTAGECIISALQLLSRVPSSRLLTTFTFPQLYDKSKYYYDRWLQRYDEVCQPLAAVQQQAKFFINEWKQLGHAAGFRCGVLTSSWLKSGEFKLHDPLLSFKSASSSDMLRVLAASYCKGVYQLWNQDCPSLGESGLCRACDALALWEVRIVLWGTSGCFPLWPDEKKAAVDIHVLLLCTRNPQDCSHQVQWLLYVHFFWFIYLHVHILPRFFITENVFFLT